MKTLMLLLALSFTASAQTFVNYTLTNFDDHASLEAEKIINVPTNTLFKIVSLVATDSNGAEVYSEYPQSTNLAWLATYDGVPVSLVQRVLGPAKIHFQGSGQPGDVCVLTAEFDPVNVAPDLSGLAVQPVGHVASVQIESSTNLTAWQTAEPGTYPATNAAAFYRLKFNVN